MPALTRTLIADQSTLKGITLERAWWGFAWLKLVDLNVVALPIRKLLPNAVMEEIE